MSKLKLTLTDLNKITKTTWVCIIAFIMALGFAAYMGATVSVDVSFEGRLTAIEQQIEQKLNSSFYGLQKSYSYFISQVGSYICLQNGTTGRLDDYDTNKTLVQEWANGNLTSGGTIYVKDIEWNTTITLNSNVMVFEQYQAELKYYRGTSSGKVGASPVQTNNTFVLQNNIDEQTLLEITPTVITKLYSLYIDLSALTQVCTISVYSKVDNSTYVEMPAMSLLNIDADNRKGLILKELMLNTDFKITIQSFALEGATRDVPYRYFTESW